MGKYETRSYDSEFDEDDNATNVPAMWTATNRSPPHEALVYLAGYFAFKWLKKSKCKECERLLKSPTSRSVAITIKNYKHSALTEPAEEMINLLTQCEKFFKENQSAVFHRSHVVTKLTEISKDIDFFQNACHPNLKMTLIKDFMLLRCRQQCKVLSQWLRASKRRK